MAGPCQHRSYRGYPGASNERHAFRALLHLLCCLKAVHAGRLHSEITPVIMWVRSTPSIQHKRGARAQYWHRVVPGRVIKYRPSQRWRPCQTTRLLRATPKGPSISSRLTGVTSANVASCQQTCAPPASPCYQCMGALTLGLEAGTLYLPSLCPMQGCLRHSNGAEYCLTWPELVQGPLHGHTGVPGEALYYARRPNAAIG